VQRDRESDLETLRAMEFAARSGAHVEAAALADAALAGGMEHPLAFNLAALGLEQRGRVADAEPLLRRAVAMAPDDIGSRNALGLCLLRLERPEEALAHFDELLPRNSDLPFLHASRANALLAIGEVGEAESSFRRAIALDPNQGIALAGLAHIDSRRGAYHSARAWAEKALAILPGFPDAVMSLAVAELGERNTGRARARVEALLTDSRLSELERAHANGVLGDIFDADNRTDEAFAAYTACNEALQRLYAGRFMVQPTALEYVYAMTRYFESVTHDAWKSPAPAAVDVSGARGHVFLVGFPRSGTTLIEVILEGHPDVVSLEEKESLIGAVREFMGTPYDLEHLISATPAALEHWRADYWRRVAACGIDVKSKIFIDKYPLNTLKLPLIARLFPGARILFACRDPRDIVLSCFRHRFKMSAAMYELLTLDGTARYYDAVMQLTVRLNHSLNLDMCLVRHEDLVTEFAREMKRICAFLRVDFAPGMGDFGLRTQKRGVLTPSTAQLVRGLNTEGLGQWRRYRARMEPLLAGLEPWVKRFYYDA